MYYIQISRLHLFLDFVEDKVEKLNLICFIYFEYVKKSNMLKHGILCIFIWF